MNSTEQEAKHGLARFLIVEKFAESNDFTCRRGDIMHHAKSRGFHESRDAINAVLHGMIQEFYLRTGSGSGDDQLLRLQPKPYMNAYSDSVVDFDPYVEYTYLPQLQLEKIHCLKRIYKEYSDFIAKKVFDEVKQDLYETIGELFSMLKSNLTVKRSPEYIFGQVIQVLSKIDTRFAKAIAYDPRFHNSHLDYKYLTERQW